ncbi:MAG: hypothetical protein WCL14_00170 [Bacteroidota bacterium]
MKNIITAVVSIMMVAAVYGQATVSPAVEVKPVVKTSVDSKSVTPLPSQLSRFYCTKCEFSALKPGFCPTHKTSLIKVGTYFCPVCNMTNGKAGKCPTDNKEFLLMTDKVKKVEMKSTDKKASN